MLHIVHDKTAILLLITNKGRKNKRINLKAYLRTLLLDYAKTIPAI